MEDTETEIEAEDSVDHKKLTVLIAKATKEACAPLHREIASLKKANADGRAADIRKQNRCGRKQTSKNDAKKDDQDGKRSVTFDDKSSSPAKRKGILQNGKQKGKSKR